MKLLKKVKGNKMIRGLCIAMAAFIVATASVSPAFAAGTVSTTKTVVSPTKVISNKTTTEKLKKASASSRTVTSTSKKIRTENSTKTTSKIVKETTTVTTKKSVYTKGSKSVKVNTKVTQAVKTTTTTYSTKKPSISEAAPKADAKLLKRFSREGYQYVIDSKLQYTGLFSSSTKKISVKYPNDHVYHELGHYLAHTTGNVDQTSEWKNIYKAEASKYTGQNKAYVTSNAREFFAETYYDYVMRKSTLKSQRPKSYAYIQKMLAKL